jgi:hypothetical protein
MPCRSAAAEVGKTREEEFLHPTTYNRITWFLNSTTSSNLLHTSEKKGYGNLALAPPEAADVIKQTELRTLFFSCEEASIVLWWRVVLMCFTERGVRVCIRWSGGHEQRN